VLEALITYLTDHWSDVVAAAVEVEAQEVGSKSLLPPPHLLKHCPPPEVTLGGNNRRNAFGKLAQQHKRFSEKLLFDQSCVMLDWNCGTY
jgi:hypothetical protein